MIPNIRLSRDFEDEVLETISSLMNEYRTAAWLPMICRELNASEPQVRMAIDVLEARGLARWEKASTYGMTDVVLVTE